MDDEQFKHDDGRSYDSVADMFDRLAERNTRRLVETLLDIAETEADQTVLDVGCGTGVVTRRILQRVDSGMVVALDISPGMLDYARRSVPDTSRVRFVRADAEILPLTDESFDCAVSQFNILHLPDHLAGLREMRRRQQSPCLAAFQRRRGVDKPYIGSQ